MRQWTEDEILQQDLERIAADDSIDWEKLRGSTDSRDRCDRTDRRTRGKSTDCGRRGAWI